VLLAALLFFGNSRLADILGVLINRIVQAFALFFSALFGRTVPAPDLVTENTAGAFRFIGFLVLVLLAYVGGSALGLRTGVTRLGQMLGAIVGGLNVFLVASQIWSYVQQYLPSAFQRESTIVITPDNDANVLRGYLPSIFAILMILLLIIVFLRLPKMRQ
jgi:hypothetical protein